MNFVNFVKLHLDELNVSRFPLANQTPWNNKWTLTSVLTRAVSITLSVFQTDLIFIRVAYYIIFSDDQKKKLMHVNSKVNSHLPLDSDRLSP